jgi:hypothetical protein
MLVNFTPFQWPRKEKKRKEKKKKAKYLYIQISWAILLRKISNIPTYIAKIMFLV